MRIKQKLILIIIFIFFLTSLSYFGFRWYKLKQVSQQFGRPKIINLNKDQDSKYWPVDFPKDPNIEVLSAQEIEYLPTLVVVEKTLKSPYSTLQVFNFFKEYLNSNNWKITKESYENQFSLNILASREGYISFVFTPHQNNTSIIYIKYEYNPLNPLKPEPKQVFKELPPNFPEYLVLKNSKIDGHSDSVNDYTVFLSSNENLKLIYDFYIKNLKENKWDIKLNRISDFGFDISASDLENNKSIKIQALPKDKNTRSILINISK